MRKKEEEHFKATIYLSIHLMERVKSIIKFHSRRYEFHPKTISEYFIFGIEEYLKKDLAEISITIPDDDILDHLMKYIYDPVASRIHAIFPGEKTKTTMNIPVRLHRELEKILSRKNIDDIKTGAQSLSDIYSDCAIEATIYLQSKILKHEHEKENERKKATSWRPMKSPDMRLSEGRIYGVRNPAFKTRYEVVKLTEYYLTLNIIPETGKQKTQRMTIKNFEKMFLKRLEIVK